MDDRSVYLVPGRNDALGAFLGDCISRQGFDVYGREILPPFSQLPFAEQAAKIERDIRSFLLCTAGTLIGESYGAYLLLHALADMDPFPGKILLFSPVLGPAVSPNGRYSSRPPRAERLLRLAAEGRFPPPRRIEIHTGAADRGCDPDLAARIGASIPAAIVHILPGQGHPLDDAYRTTVITAFLATS